MSKLSVHQRKARSFIQREDWGNALAELERMLGADGDNPTLHNQIGDVYLRKDDVGKACDHFERAIDLYAAVGLHNNAVALCKKVMRLRPGRHEMRYRLARLRMDQGFPGEAATFLREYFDHITLHESNIEAFEGRCREIIDLMPDVAPVGKILEKLEAAQRYVTAFEIVRKQAQCATDAGDDAAAARYTEKMRSLRILVERSGGRDLLAELGPAPDAEGAARAEEPAAAADPLVGADDPESLLLPDPNSKTTEGTGARKEPDVQPGKRAPVAAKPRPDAVGVEPGKPAARPSATRSFVDPNTVAGLDAVEAGDVEDAVAKRQDEASASATGTPAERAAKAVPAEPPLSKERPVRESDPQLGLEGPAARLSKPNVPDLDSTRVERADADATAAGEDGGVAVPEYNLSDSSFADLSADFETDDAPSQNSETNDASAWSIDASAGAGDVDIAAAPGGNGSNGHGGVAHPPAEPDPQAIDGADAATGAPPKGTSWVDALRRTPLWIPSESAPPSATPEGWATGANMELESVIDSFREQMARALDGDGAARYDLGVAYYEMGLYNEALAEFEAASRCPGLEVQSYEMLAACLLQTDRHAEVVELLLPVLAADGHSPRGRLGLQYSLGLAYEALGDREQARRCFEEVALVDIDFKDVQARLQGIA